MPADYRAIHRENQRRYGTGVREYGDTLLPHRYGDRSHFIYELLQNAEDALARRQGWEGLRSVRFHLTPSELRVRHCGIPFDEADVESICGIGASTKDARLTEIGRFGIGFKSVYAYTDRPEVHSGPEDFAIEHYVLPGADPDGGMACIEDWNLRGLDALLAGVARMPTAERDRRRELLRQELEALPGLNDLAVRSGKYECGSQGIAPVPVSVPAAWMRRLTASCWAPEARPLVQIGAAKPAAGPRRKDPKPPRVGVGVDTETRDRVPPGPEEAELGRRRTVERSAIRLILEEENWLAAAPDNPGFDLYRKDDRGRKTPLCEVKALSGSLDDGPALLTPNEFRCALEHRGNYWLYIVEDVASDHPRIIRIRDPAGTAGRFAFGPEWRDHGRPPP